MTVVERGKLGRRRASEVSARTAILAHAVEAFALRGYDGVSIREICSEAGANIAMISYHFGSKLELWEACVDMLAERIAPTVQEIRETLDTVADYHDRLRLAVRKFIELNVTYPSLGLFIHQEAVQVGRRQAHVSRRLIAPFHEITVPLLQDGMSRGLIRQQDPSLLFFMAGTSIACIINARALVQSLGDGLVDEDRFLDNLCQGVLALFQGCDGEHPHEKRGRG
ncbi:TetR/AcrR family transcriptional regulator [Roseomonas mucosa]